MGKSAEGEGKVTNGARKQEGREEKIGKEDCNIITASSYQA